MSGNQVMLVSSHGHVSREKHEMCVCMKCVNETAFAAAVQQMQLGTVVTHLVCIGPNCRGEGTVVNLLGGAMQGGIN